MQFLNFFLAVLFASAYAADFNTKDKVYNYFSVIIPYQTEAVWAVLRDFPHMHKWNFQFHDLQLFVVGKDTLAREMFGNDQRGADKRVYEKLNLLDDENYHFSYSVIPYTQENIHFSPFPANVFGHRADAWAHPITEGKYAGQTYLEWRIQKDGSFEEELPSQNGPSNHYIFQGLFNFMTQYLEHHNTEKTDNYDFWARSSQKEQRVRNFQGAILEVSQSQLLEKAKEVYPTLGEGQVLPRSEGLPWPRLGSLSAAGSSSLSNYEGEVIVAPVVLPDGTKQTFVGRRDYFSTTSESAKVAEEARDKFVKEINQLKEVNKGKDEL